MAEYIGYRSPIRLLTELGLDSSEINGETLKAERKRLLLELQISTNQTVQVGGRTLTKNDVIEIFDELHSVSDLEYHKKIFNHTVLLRLLENFEIIHAVKKNDPSRIHFTSEFEEAEFKNFISPFLANSIDLILSGIIQNSNYLELNRIASFFGMLNEADGIYAFRKFNNYCLSLHDKFKSISGDRTVYPADQFIFIHYYPFYFIVNEVNTFYPNLADKVATTLVSFTASHQNSRGQSDYLLKASNQMCKLNCSDITKEIIINNDAIFRSEIGQDVAQPNSAITIFVSVAFGFIFLVLMIYLFSGPNK